MGQLGQTTSMYVYHMRSADACSPTHSPRAFLQFVARSDDDTRRTERTQVRQIQLHIVQHLVIGTPIQAFAGVPLPMYVAVLNASAQGISACPNGGAWQARHWRAPQFFILIHH